MRLQLVVVFSVSLFVCSSPPPSTVDSGTVVSCTDPLRACGSECIDVTLDSRHCGACGQPCPDGQSCAGSQCYPRMCGTGTCPESQVCVDNVCADRSCFGVSCPQDQACAGGRCLPKACMGVVCMSDEVCDQGMCREAACVGVLCPAGLKCVGGSCRQDTCTDGVKNGTETDSDCGGICERCGVGRTCAGSSDCTSLVCSAGTCAAPSCTDNVRNGTEGDVDCGGTCSGCEDGRRCTAAPQCASGVCTQGTCSTATCADQTANGGETDVDCGGPCPAKCALGKKCAAGVDCTTALCQQGQCAPGTCTNNLHDGDETDRDCGGSCAGCMTGQSCDGGTDCLNGVCSAAKLCVAPTCFDLTQNGTESDRDCGGTCAQCVTGQSCNVPGDCVSGVCLMKRCAAPTCTDVTKNGAESDVDCGGDAGCMRCAVGLVCRGNFDCQSQDCDAGHCDPFGLFALPLELGGGVSPQDLLAADLDSDGLIDLAVANSGSYDISTWFSNGNGTFDAGVTLQVSGAMNARGPVGIAVGDVNGDGRLDFVNAREAIGGNSCGGTSYSGCVLTVLKGAGNRSFFAGVDTFRPEPAASGCGWRIATGRIDNDTLDDIIVSDGYLNAGTCGQAADRAGAWLYLTLADGGYGAPQLLSQGGPWVATGDLNGDSRTDVLGRSAWYSAMRVFVNDAGTGYSGPLTATVAAGTGEMVLARVDSDNVLDVVVASKQANRVGVARGFGDGNLLSPNSYAVTDPDGVAVADFDGDGKLDVAVGGRGIEVLLGNGDGTLRPGTRYREAQLGDTGDIVAADFNGDGKPDVACVANGKVYLLLNAR